MPEEELLHSIIARRLASLGYLPIPCRKSKRPALETWKDLQLNRLSDAYFEEFDKHPYLAILTGAKSGNLEVLDIDSKYDLNRGQEGDIYEAIQDNIVEYKPSLWHDLVVCKTPSGGYHIIYKCDEIAGNKKYAQRLTTEKERIEENLTETGYKVLTESRGSGGYICTYPSEGYEFIKGNWASVPRISVDDRRAIIDIAKSFDEVRPKTQEALPQVVPAIHTKHTKYQITPWDDFNDRGNLVDILLAHGWTVTARIPNDVGSITLRLKRPGTTESEDSGTFNHVPNRLFCFSTSTPFEPNQTITPFDVYLHYEANGNMRQAIQQLLSQGYGRTFDPNQIREASKIQQPSSDHTAPTPYDMPSQGVSLCTWWDTYLKQDKDGTWKKTIKTNKHKFYKWMSDKGFRRLKRGESSYEILLIEGSIVRRIIKEEIMTWVLAWIAKLPKQFDYITPEELANVTFSEVEKFLHDYRIAQIKDFNKEDLLKDDKDNSYVPFKNGVLHVTKDGWKLIPYTKIYKLVWQEKIKQVVWEDSTIDEINDHDFSQFLFEIAGGEEDRYVNLLQLLGYALSTWKDPSFPPAIILCDSKVSDRSEGGTGKGILVKALSFMRSVVIEDGKQMNRKVNSEFRFGRITEHTEIYNISDVEKGFNFESMFVLLTEGIPVRKLFKDEIFIPYEDSPKVIISTNYTVAGRGSSHDRRKLEFELSDTFSATYTPMDRFKGKAFFDSWNRDEWAAFYGIMARCLKQYIKSGKPKFEGKNIELRKFIDESSSDFSNWFFDMFGTKEDVEKGQAKETGLGRHAFNLLYNNYLGYSGLERHEARPKKFYQMMESGCKYIGLELKQITDKSDKATTAERFFEISDPKKKVSKFKPTIAPTNIKSLSLDDNTEQDAINHQRELGLDFEE